MYAAYDEKKKLWGNLDEGRKVYPETSLGQVILDVLAKHDSKVAQINDDTGVQMTFREVRLNTIRVAQNLLKRGYKPRQVFGFMSGNSDNLLPIFLSTICLGCPIVPLNTSLSKEEIIRILVKTKPSVFFCDAKPCAQLIEALQELNWNVKIFIFDEQVNDFERVESLLIETGDEENFIPIFLDMENDIAGILSSSGTTGPAKCVSVSYSHTGYTLPKIHDGTVLCLLSIYWTVGIKAIMDCVYGGTTRIIATKPFTPRYFLELIEKHKVGVLICSPFRTVACLKSDLLGKIDLSSVKTIYYCGNAMPLSLVGEIQRYFFNAQLLSYYGLTEIGSISNCLLDVTRREYSGHRLYNGCLVKIVDDYGNRCGADINGEICVKKSYKFRGYFKDPAATEAAVDEEGFFQTGDIGHFDENGGLFIEGRKKNIMQVFHFGGFVLPTEIEEHLISLPGVKEVCVVGIPLLKLAGFMLPAAVIVRKTNSSLKQNDIFNAIAEIFPNRAKLRGGVYFIDSLPKTHNGKLIRAKITEIAVEKFSLAKEFDPNLQKYLSDYPEDNRQLI